MLQWNILRGSPFDTQNVQKAKNLKRHLNFPLYKFCVPKKIILGGKLISLWYIFCIKGKIFKKGKLNFPLIQFAYQRKNFNKRGIKFPFDAFCAPKEKISKRKLNFPLLHFAHTSKQNLEINLPEKEKFKKGKSHCFGTQNVSKKINFKSLINKNINTKIKQNKLQWVQKKKHYLSAVHCQKYGQTSHKTKNW